MKKRTIWVVLCGLVLGMVSYRAASAEERPSDKPKASVRVCSEELNFHDGAIYRAIVVTVVGAEQTSDESYAEMTAKKIGEAMVEFGEKNPGLVCEMQPLLGNRVVEMEGIVGTTPASIGVILRCTPQADSSDTPDEELEKGKKKTKDKHDSLSFS